MPRQELRDPRGARLHRRHLGPVPLSRHPLRLRHVHARLFVQAVDRTEGDRGGPASSITYAIPPPKRIDRKIRFHHRVKRPSWSRQSALDGGGRARGRRGRERDVTSLAISCSCARATTIRGGLHAGICRLRGFAGRIVHPQKWPEDLDYAGKRVVVIGSGATAVTLVPEMAKTAAHVTMLQRSPTSWWRGRRRMRSPTNCGESLG